MKISCDIINDLIPLYLEGMLSEDGKKLVEEHLDECPEQLKYVEQYKIESKNKDVNKLTTENRINTSKPIKRIKSDMMRLIVKIALFALTLSCFLAMVVLNYKGVKNGENLSSFERVKPEILFNGEDIILKSDKRIYAYSTSLSYGENKKAIVTLGIDTEKNPNNKVENDFGNELKLSGILNSSITKDTVDAIYYMDYPNNKLIKLYGENSISRPVEFWNPTLQNNIIYYLIGATILTLIVAILLKNKKIFDIIASSIFFATLSVLISYLMIRYKIFTPSDSLTFTKGNVFGLSGVFIRSMLELIVLPFIAMVSGYSIFKQFKRNKFPKEVK